MRTLLTGNITPVRSVVPGMTWIVWLPLGWLALSVAAAVVFGRVIRARDEREKSRQLEHRDDDPSRSAS